MSSQTSKKAFVGMSGGVDSSVSAALLKSQGYDVTGVFIKVWAPDWMECTWREDRLDAMRVCAQLGIPFLTLDLEETYKREVVDYMVAGYKAGKTPNPDIMCNARVKFGGFFDWAIAQGADVVATGHYARVERDGDRWKLLMGEDQGKDQSYFLWTLSQMHLSRTLFPVGSMEKSEVRKLAKRFKLPVAEKRDSQGLCFIGKVDIKEFLSHYLPLKRGDVLDEQGKKIGEHDGAIFLTVGERHGFNISTKTPNGAPYYIIARDTDNNTVTVSHDFRIAEQGSGQPHALTEVNWISGRPEAGKKYSARIRHLGSLLPSSIISGDSFKVSFDEPTSVASGQSIVVYDGDTCLGGGIVV